MTPAGVTLADKLIGSSAQSHPPKIKSTATGDGHIRLNITIDRHSDAMSSLNLAPLMSNAKALNEFLISCPHMEHKVRSFLIKHTAKANVPSWFMIRTP